MFPLIATTTGAATIRGLFSSPGTPRLAIRVGVAVSTIIRRNGACGKMRHTEAACPLRDGPAVLPPHQAAFITAQLNWASFVGVPVAEGLLPEYVRNSPTNASADGDWFSETHRSFVNVRFLFP